MICEFNRIIGGIRRRAKNVLHRLYLKHEMKEDKKIKWINQIFNKTKASHQSHQRQKGTGTTH